MRMSLLTSLLCCLLVVGCTRMPSEPAATATPPQSVPATVATPATPVEEATPARADGYGPLRFGMQSAAVREAWGDPLQGPAQAEGCTYLTPGAPEGVRFMLEDDHLVRYDVSRSGEIAPGGGRVGMDAGALRSRYAGRVDVQPHKYVEGAQVLRVADAAAGSALVFETDASGRVERWRVGVPPQVDYVEGCG